MSKHVLKENHGMKLTAIAAATVLVAITVLVWEIAPTRGDELPLPDATTIESTDGLPIPPSTMRPVQWSSHVDSSPVRTRMFGLVGLFV